MTEIECSVILSRDSNGCNYKTPRAASRSPAPSMPRHARTDTRAIVLALELVLAVVDAATAMDVIEALRHVPELLHALGEAVPDARARFTRYIRPILAKARDVAPACYYVLWGPADSIRIGPWALRMLQMSTVDPQVHADSAHVVADCFLYMNVDDDDYRNEYILNAVRASGFHRALIARLPASEGDIHVAYTRLLCVMITAGYLHECNETRWTYAQIAEDLGGVCLERLLLQCLQYTSGDPDHWGDSVQCLYTIMFMASDFSLASPYSSGSRPRLFADPDVRAMLRRDCHRASPCADRRCSYYRSGLFDVVLQRMGTLRWALHNEDCLFVLEILFATCPESRQAVFDAVCAKAGGDMNYFYKFDHDWSGSLSDHFKYTHTK